MSKQVTVFLPTGVIDHAVIDDDSATTIVASGQFKDGPGTLEMPIETIIINGKEKYYGRYSINVTDEEVRKALSK